MDKKCPYRIYFLIVQDTCITICVWLYGNVIVVFFSIIFLVLGYVGSTWLSSHMKFSQFLQGFVKSFVSLVVLLDIMPHCFHEIGWYGWVIFSIGLGIMFVFDTQSTHTQQRIGTNIALLIGFGTHAMVDGVALGSYQLANTMEAWLLGGAVLLHRFPIGVVLGSIPKKREAVTIVGVICVATIIGFYMTVEMVEQAWLSWIQALSAGALLHLVFEHAAPIVVSTFSTKHQKIVFAGGCASAIGCFFVAMAMHEHMSLFSILLAIFIVGIILQREWYPNWMPMHKK